MKRVRTTLGSYLPFFFHMDISFPFPSGLSPLEKLDEKFLSVYIHEYIHFLQDITTYSGLNNGYVYSEYIHGVVTHIYENGQQTVGVPYNLPDNYFNVKLNRFMNDAAFGNDEERDILIIKDIRKKTSRIPISNPYLTHYTRVLIDTIPATNGPLEFGRLAIMESMAYMIEKKVTIGSPSAPDYPYRSASLVADKIYPGFSDNDVYVLALCDMSLQFSEPGKVFVSVLEQYKKDGYMPTRAEDIIDYFYSKPCDSLFGQKSLSDSYLAFSFQVGQRLKTYLNHPQFKAFHEAIHKLIGFGMNVRYYDRYYFLNMYRAGYALDNPILKQTNRKVGTPVIVDSNYDYWVVYPWGCTSKNYEIEYFAAIEEIFKLFDKGSTACDMYQWCSKSKQTSEDDRCIFEPWTRTSDKYLCPYAMLLRHWKLSGLSFIEK